MKQNRKKTTTPEAKHYDKVLTMAKKLNELSFLPELQFPLTRISINITEARGSIVLLPAEKDKGILSVLYDALEKTVDINCSSGGEKIANAFSLVTKNHHENICFRINKG